MGKAPRLFDPKSYEIAEYFLPDDATDRLKNHLAQHVQDAVENWFFMLQNGLLDAQLMGAEMTP